MDTLTGIILGVVQGLTEFLPISSSGHLVLFQSLFGFREPELLLDTALHFGTLVAVVIYFRSDLYGMAEEIGTAAVGRLGGGPSPVSIRERPHAMLAFWVLVGTVPTAGIGLLFRKPLEALFSDVPMAGLMLVLTGMILILPKLLPMIHPTRMKIGFLTALAVGAAQGLAIVPGISRSGITIVCGLLCGLERDLAGRFSFLLSIPAILGALILQLWAGNPGSAGPMSLLLGTVSSGVVGFLALKLLMGLVRKGRLHIFAPYCWGIGLLILGTQIN